MGYTGGRSDNCPDPHGAFWIFTSLLSYKINWYESKTVENAHMEECEPVLTWRLHNPWQSNHPRLSVKHPPHPSPSAGQWVETGQEQPEEPHKDLKCASGLQTPQIQIWVSCMEYVEYHEWLDVNLFWRVVWVREAVAKQCTYWCVTHVSILCIPFLRILRMYSIRSSGRVAMSVGWLVCLQVFLLFP